MIVLKCTGVPFYAEALKLFDGLLFLFTESIDIRIPELLALDLGVYEDMEEEAPGIAFYDIDFNEVDKGNPHLFKLIGHWEDPHPLSASESSLAFSQDDPLTPASLPTPDDEISTKRFETLLKTENAVWERTGGYVAFEILSEEESQIDSQVVSDYAGISSDWFLGRVKTCKTFILAEPKSFESR
jgi:hypothetical protein